MRRLIHLSCLCLALSVAEADDNVSGAFVVAPVATGDFVACGSNLASCETDADGGSYISGLQLFVTHSSVMTSIEKVRGEDGKSLFSLRDGLLTVNAPSAFYAFDGKLLFRLKKDAHVSTSELPKVFIIQLKGGVSYKIRKSK